MRVKSMVSACPLRLWREGLKVIRYAGDLIHLRPGLLKSKLAAKPSNFSTSFCAAAFGEYAAETHAQRVAGRELSRAAVAAERVGEQQLADVFGGLSPLSQRLDLCDALAAAELVFLHLLGDEPGDHCLADAIGSHLPGHLLVFLVPLLAPSSWGTVSAGLFRFPC